MQRGLASHLRRLTTLVLVMILASTSLPLGAQAEETSDDTVIADIDPTPYQYETETRTDGESVVWTEVVTQAHANGAISAHMRVVGARIDDRLPFEVQRTIEDQYPGIRYSNPDVSGDVFI